MQVGSAALSWVAPPHREAVGWGVPSCTARRSKQCGKEELHKTLSLESTATTCGLRREEASWRHVCQGSMAFP